MTIKIDELKEDPSGQQTPEEDSPQEQTPIPVKMTKRKKKTSLKKIIKKYRKDHSPHSSWVLERKFWFNEKKLKEVLASLDVPQNFKHLRILKEHAASITDEYIDFKPAFKIIEKGLSKAERKRLATSLERHPTFGLKSRRRNDTLQQSRIIGDMKDTILDKSQPVISQNVFESDNYIGPTFNATFDTSSADQLKFKRK